MENCGGAFEGGVGGGGGGEGRGRTDAREQRGECKYQGLLKPSYATLLSGDPLRSCLPGIS